MIREYQSFIGNSSVVRAVRSSIERGRIANAYLFAGPDAVGKRSLAMLVAMSILCKNTETSPCGECSACHRILQSREKETYHPDLTVIEPDGAFIKVDQIRENLISKVRMPPHESSRQVFIIDPADNLHLSAANAFLKSLEEAPGRSVFFLISTNPSALLPTIRSRCQIFSFNRLPLDDLAAVLIESRNLPPEEAQLVARLSLGAPGAALTFDLERHKEERAQAMNMVRLSLAEGSITSVFELTASFQKERQRFPAIFDTVTGLLRDMMVLAASNDTGRIINIDLETELRRLATKHEPLVIARFIDTLAESLEPLHRNVRVDTISEYLIISGRQHFRT